MKLQDWSAQKEWLQSTFNENVRIIWHGPEEFSSHINVEISDGRFRSSVSGRGVTGEESVCDLFKTIVNHDPQKHIIFGPENVRVVVNSDTLDLIRYNMY